MFFPHPQPWHPTSPGPRRGRRGQDFEKLAIFGDIRGRRGAELKVLSAIETKSPGGTLFQMFLFNMIYSVPLNPMVNDHYPY